MTLRFGKDEITEDVINRVEELVEQEIENTSDDLVKYRMSLVKQRTNNLRTELKSRQTASESSSKTINSESISSESVSSESVSSESVSSQIISPESVNSESVNFESIEYQSQLKPSDDNIIGDDSDIIVNDKLSYKRFTSLKDGQFICLLCQKNKIISKKQGTKIRSIVKRRFQIGICLQCVIKYGKQPSDWRIKCNNFLCQCCLVVKPVKYLNKTSKKIGYACKQCTRDSGNVYLQINHREHRSAIDILHNSADGKKLHPEIVYSDSDNEDSDNSEKDRKNRLKRKSLIDVFKGTGLDADKIDEYLVNMTKQKYVVKPLVKQPCFICLKLKSIDLFPRTPFGKYSLWCSKCREKISQKTLLTLEAYCPSCQIRQKIYNFLLIRDKYVFITLSCSKCHKRLKNYRDVIKEASTNSIDHTKLNVESDNLSIEY